MRFQTIILGGTGLIPESANLAEVQQAIESLLVRVYGCQDPRIAVSVKPSEHPYGRNWQELATPIKGQVNGLDGFSGTLVARDAMGRAICRLPSGELRIISEDWFIRHKDQSSTKSPRVKSDKPEVTKTTKPVRKTPDLTPYA
jgi:hypothetical protein